VRLQQLAMALPHAAPADAELPPIPSRSHGRNPHHHSSSHTQSRRRAADDRAAGLEPAATLHPLRTSSLINPRHRSHGQTPASPEIISDLITSLSALPKPSKSYLDVIPSQASISLPSSPGSGSFGVDYGAFTRPSANDSLRSPISLDELAACPPVIRTSRKPSGYTPSTAVSPGGSSAAAASRSPRSTSRDSGGFRSFIRRASTSSRPSSNGSFGSKYDDANSVGSASIDQGAAPVPDLRRQRSVDSWSRKVSRNSKGLMYMSSKERLREKDNERKRASGGLQMNTNGSLVGGNGADGAGRQDALLVETPITEEPHTAGFDFKLRSSSEGPQSIPTRDSSLRKTGSHSSQRLSRRQSKQRDSDGRGVQAIPEADEQRRSRDGPKSKEPAYAVPSGSFLLGEDESIPPSIPRSHSSRPARARGSSAEPVRRNVHSDGINDEGAPFPFVSQGPRRDKTPDRLGRRLSARHSAGPADDHREGRSSSRLQRSGRQSEEIGHGSRSETAKKTNSMPASHERPTSADSIDDAVESYLCSPRLSQKIRHPQTGRVISFSEVGDAEGSAVFCCVGMGLTRYITAFYDELALTLRLRLITPDRPGVGDSEPYSDGTTTPLNWPDDVYAICQALKITKFSVMAHSAGAIYALATALRMPQHIRGRIHLLAPWIPPSQMSVFGTTQAQPPTNAIPTSQRILRALPTSLLKAANSSFMTATSSSITSSLPKNPRKGRRKASAQARESTGQAQSAAPPEVNLETRDDAIDAGRAEPQVPMAMENMDGILPPTSPLDTERSALGGAASPVMDKERQMTYDVRLTHAIWELATTGANPAVDLLVCLERRHTIGFRYVDITRPVIIHHGSRDTRVPVDNVKWLGKTMKRCEVRVLEGEGHGLMASATVMGSVLMEISKEWEDWNRVTSADGRREREREREKDRGLIGRWGSDIEAVR
jgi:pimeloyl-ACP methyl ester carboxylesterase